MTSLFVNLGSPVDDEPQVEPSGELLVVEASQSGQSFSSHGGWT